MKYVVEPKKVAELAFCVGAARRRAVCHGHGHYHGAHGCGTGCGNGNSAPPPPPPSCPCSGRR